MNRNGVSIKYGDVAPEAKENFFPEVSETKFDTISQLQQYNLQFPNYANPCELYSVVLNGEATAFPSTPDESNLGLWSEQISNADGTFTTPIVLTLTSQGQFTSQGFTFTFDTYNDIFATDVNIHWWRDAEGTLSDLGEMDFEPDSAFYFCHNRVENYNRVVITFKSINMPYNRLKLRAIDYGYGTIFRGNELRNVKLIQEIDPISSQIAINIADFTLDSKSNMDYSFQAKQPLSVYFNDKLYATTFVKTSKRQARFLWNIQSEDYIGIMDGVSYPGGIYENQNAVELLQDIFGTAKVPFKIDDIFADMTVSGYITYTTCREALMQVAFAIQAVVDTSNSDVVNVFGLDNEVKQTIPLNRIMQGQSFEDGETVTGVEVAVHSYKVSEEVTDNIYNADTSGTGKNILVKFSEPYATLWIADGEILKYGANYAIINADAGCELSGRKYEHTTQIHRMNNPIVLESEIEKVVAIENATLVSQSNIDMVLKKCFLWLTKTSTTNLKIVEGKHIQYGGIIKYGSGRKFGSFKYGQLNPDVVTYDEPVHTGENINAETEYMGVVSGRITKQSFSLNGNIIIKEAVLK